MSKLFLYSLALNEQQAATLTSLVGKNAEHIRFALIENAADIVPNSRDWLGGFRDMLRVNGYQLELIDLRQWAADREGLRHKLLSKDVIWVGGGHTYYLRWLMNETGADGFIKEFVNQGKVYAGWSAGAVVAGPTIEYFDTMGDDPDEAPVVILDGLNLTNVVVVPHLGNKDFAEGVQLTNDQLLREGYQTILLRDNQAVVIDGMMRRII